MSNDNENDNTDKIEEISLSTCNSSNNNISDSSFRIDFNKYCDSKLVNFFCCKCSSIPVLNFIGNLPQVACGCGLNEKLTIEEVYEKFLFNSVNINYDDIYRCPKHWGKKKKKRKKYHYYCIECKQNQCGDCKSNCPHDDKGIFKFDQNQDETEQLIKKLKKILDNDEKINYKLREIFEIIFDNFSNNPYHYSYFANIEKIEKYLMKSNKAIKDNDK